MGELNWVGPLASRRLKNVSFAWQFATIAVGFSFSFTSQAHKALVSMRVLNPHFNERGRDHVHSKTASIVPKLLMKATANFPDLGLRQLESRVVPGSNKLKS